MEKRIINYPNYTINENGDIFNTLTNKLLKGSISEGGYKYYRLSKDGKKKMFYAHRLVAEHFLENPNNLLIVNHKDGNKLNNNVNNLEWVTQSENVQHAHDNSLIAGRREAEFYEGDLDGEIWKNFLNLPYSVSSLGRVKNDRTNRILKPSVTCGYYKVRPSVDGVPYDIMVHNLVYCIFNNLQTIPQGYVVDHINANKLDNRLENLRLITQSENVKAALYEQGTNKTAKKVSQYTLDGKWIADFPSAREAARILGLDSSTISKVCRRVNKTHGGFTFKYKE